MGAENKPGLAMGEALRRHRIAAGLNQRELADRLGWDPTYISLLESGRREVKRINTINALADALELTAEERLTLFAAAGLRLGGTA